MSNSSFPRTVFLLLKEEASLDCEGKDVSGAVTDYLKKEAGSYLRELSNTRL